jgi:hypothetical protein
MTINTAGTKLAQTFFPALGIGLRRWKTLAALALVMAGVIIPARAGTVLGPWYPLFEGVDHAVGTNTSGGGGMTDLMVMNAVRIDLTDTNIQLYASPRTTNYLSGTRETGGYTTTNFIKAHGLQVAVNANFFHDGGTSDTESPSYTDPQGTPFDLIGLEISQGQVVSPQDSSDYVASLMFTSNNQATFVPTNWPAHPTTGIYTAVTGLYAILYSNVNIGSNYIGSPDFAHQINPHTAFGLSQDRRHLYLITIDGRQSGYSDGALDWETARWLQLLGATDGAQMDGGGSTCLAIQTSSGATVELNHDSAAAADGVERTVGSHLGVYAAPVPGFINNVSALADDTAATITWTTLTNATSQAQFGITPNLNQSTALFTNLVTSHAVLLSGLTPGTGYYFTVYSMANGVQYASSNFFFTTSNYVSSNLIFDVTNTWTFNTNNLDGVNWTAPGYDDSGWTGSGPGLLWADKRGPNSALSPLGINMPIDTGTQYPYVTYYFRTHFSYTGALPGASMVFTTYIDDGAVFYLNGVELYRLRMPAAPAVIANSTLASGYPCSGDASCAAPFTVSGGAVTNLVDGDNVLAVEVHNYNAASPDITMGTALAITSPMAAPPQLDIQTTSASVTIDWARGGFTLQETDSLTDPWIDVPGPVVSSPFIWTNTQSSMFFRLRR